MRLKKLSCDISAFNLLTTNGFFERSSNKSLMIKFGLFVTVALGFKKVSFIHSILTT